MFNHPVKNILPKSRSLSLILLLIILLAAGYMAIRYLFPPSLKPGDYKTAVVDYGPVVTSVPATGIVNPQSEVLLLSPSSSLVSSIRLAPGSHVTKGDIILILDPKPLQQEIGNLNDQLAVMENDLQKNRLNAKSIRVDLDYSAEVKRLKIASLNTEIADQDQLLKVGGISPALHDQTKQELVLAQKDLQATLEKNSIRLKQLDADEKGLLLQMDIHKKDLEEKENLLNRLTVRAPSDGIILGIFANAGEKVEKDKLLVRMSDLSSFKIAGSIDNRYMDRIKTGGEVYAIIDNARLRGTIGNVSPVIKDRKIDFDVFLDHNRNLKLIPNLEVNLMIVIDRKDSVLRVERGPAFNHSKRQDVYVVKNGEAIRTSVTVGLIGTEYVEIQNGLKPGQRVITSDVAPFRHRKEVVFEDL